MGCGTKCWVFTYRDYNENWCHRWGL